MIIKKFVPVLIAMLMILSIGASAATTTTNSNYTINQISQSANNTKNYVETKYDLPKNVTIGNSSVTNPQFLYLLTTATLNINSSKYSSITVKNVTMPTNPSENVASGTLTKSAYLTIASKINAYIATNGRSPNYATTSLGTMKYQSLIYMYSKIMNYYQLNKVLPGTVSVKSWYALTLGPAAKYNGTAVHTTTRLGSNTYGYVNKLGPFGTGTNKVAIIIGVHPQEEQTHIAMLNAIEALSSTLKNVQIWVYQVVVYTQYQSDYTLSRQYGQNLANKYVVPNIDTSYKLALDTHGNRGYYFVNGKQVTNSMFAPSNGTKSVYYQNKIINSTNGTLTYYRVVDGTSPSKVTLPIAAKGIPTVIYEQYLNQANYAQLFYQHALQVVKAINAAFA